MICNIKLQKYHLYLLHLCFIIKWWAVPGAPGQQSKSNLYIFKALCNGRSRKTPENYILLFSFNDAIRPFQFFFAVSSTLVLYIQDQKNTQNKKLPNLFILTET